MTITAGRPVERGDSPPETPQRPHWNGWVFGPADQPRWARPGLWLLLAATAVLYLWGLGASGWANDFYAAAVQAGTQSWKALLFGSLDSGNAITVDKPPASLWVMGLSGRLFGFSSWSMLVPQALMGVASVGLVYAAVRRWAGPAAGLLAGVALAATPVAALMFRFNNPDALLVLLLVIAAYCTVRATESGSGRWLAFAGVAVGFGFLTKMMQAFLVLPGFALVFLIAAPIALRARLLKLVGALVAVLVSGGWFVALVSLWPADSRPYIGGSTDNSLLELALGYNGLGRVLGGDGNPGGNGGGGGPGGNGGFGGGTGITRLFSASIGAEISWLLPTALIGLIAMLWITRRAPRTDLLRASLILWGGWLLVTGIVLSYMQGIMHPYYTVALAPAIAALIGITATRLWSQRETRTARIALAVMSITTGIWSFVLLNRDSGWHPALRWIVLIGSLVIAALIVARAHRLGRFTTAIALLAVLTGLAGPAAYTLATAATPHNGSIPTSGPASAADHGGFGGHGGPGGSFPTGGSPGGNNQQETPSATGESGAMPEDARPPGFGGASAGNPQLDNLLTATGNRWAAATVGSQAASTLELSTGTSIMAIGGFSGGDNSPTLAQFQQYVATGQIHYFITGGGMGGFGGAPGESAPGDDAAVPGSEANNENTGPTGHMGGFGNSGSGSAITSWVEAHYTAVNVNGTTIYDLTQPKS